MGVACSVIVHDHGLTAALTGTLTLADTAALRDKLFKCLAEQPAGLVIDLAGLSVGDRLALSVFTTVSRQAARWPGIPVLYCSPSPEVRTLLAGGAYRRLPIVDSLAEARRRARDETTLPALIDDLLPIAGAARQARNVVAEACLCWGLLDLVAPASVIVGELVTNVVEHASTMATLRISLRPRFVTVAVQDGSTSPPRLAAPGGSGGRGLRLVEAMAHSWGWLPTDGGKVVWAALSRP